MGAFALCIVSNILFEVGFSEETFVGTSKEGVFSPDQCASGSFDST